VRPSVLTCSRSVSRWRAESYASAAIVPKRSTSSTSASVNATSAPLRYTFSAPTTRSSASSGTHTNASGSSGVPATTLQSGSSTVFGTLSVRRLRTAQPVIPVPSGIALDMISSTQLPTANMGRSIEASTSIS
jgi:hypothetical protein